MRMAQSGFARLSPRGNPEDLARGNCEEEIIFDTRLNYLDKQLAISSSSDSLSSDGFGILILGVVVPPNSPRIISEDRRIDTSKAIAGVYQEDDVMRLKCDVVGGRPLPSVTWWINGNLIDDTHFNEGTDTVVNRLQEMKAERHLDGAQIECRASNNNVSQPQSRILEIKINLRPVSVSIIQKPEYVRVGQEYELVCQAFGSKPEAIITWYKGREVVHDERVTSHYQENPEVTNSLLKYRPRRADNGKRITCRAQNPAMPLSAIEDSLVLAVMYPPIVQLGLGRSIQPDDIKERDDVYFECDVKANPPIQGIEWQHNGKTLEHNVARGVILSNQSLVIQRISRDDAGEYVCKAENAHGAGKSNPVLLGIKYRPVCQHGGESPQFGVVQGGNVTLQCDVLANPPVHQFRWWVNKDGKAIEVRPEDIRSLESSSSIVYSPESELDYGSVSCMATNTIGRQNHPCTFIITAATKPRRPENCNVHNSTNGGGHQILELKCDPPYDGGLDTSFVLEIYDTKTNRLRHNFTSQRAPHFVLRDLRSLHPLRFRLYAVNARGVSENSEIPVVMVNQPEKHTDTITVSSGINTDSIVLMICGLAIALLIVLFFVGLVIHRRQGLSKKLLDCHATNSNPTSESPNANASKVQSITAESSNPNKSQIFKNEALPDPDPRTKSTLSFNPGTLKPTEGADINLQSRLIDPRSGASIAQQTKPILKTSSHIDAALTPAPPYSHAPIHPTGSNAGNWYPNPMDQDAAVWIAREHGQYYYPPCGTLPNKRAQLSQKSHGGHSDTKMTYPDFYPKSNTLNRRRPMQAGPHDTSTYSPHTSGHIGLPMNSSMSIGHQSHQAKSGSLTLANDSRRLRYNSSVRDLETDTEYLLHGEDKGSQNKTNYMSKNPRSTFLDENIHV
ncbi:hypothetical protein TCAL_11263 [Tigriopus californicus]|uniref:Nephrin n=1 Tax=Tigriopus californicus TaxID=6832 RepID=A0A553P3M4_TIGCA|nr:hypothetical protein TCAL_11263 [Tigriopus californicus]